MFLELDEKLKCGARDIYTKFITQGASRRVESRRSQRHVATTYYVTDFLTPKALLLHLAVRVRLEIGAVAIRGLLPATAHGFANWGPIQSNEVQPFDRE